MLEFNFYDVGHGACSHIITPNGKHILVDIGSSDDWSVSRYLKNKLGIEQIDCSIITHPHMDHISDIVNLLDCGLKPRTLLRNKSAFPLDIEKFDRKEDRLIATEMNEINNKYTEQVSWEMSPCNPNYNGGVTIKVWPSINCSKDDLNTFSGVYVFEYANKKVVITGDNNKEILKKMILDDEFSKSVEKADILLASHHGRDSYFCEEFFKKVNPLLTVISDKPKEHDTQANAVNNYKGRGLCVNGEIRYVPI